MRHSRDWINLSIYQSMLLTYYWLLNIGLGLDRIIYVAMGCVHLSRSLDLLGASTQWTRLPVIRAGLKRRWDFSGQIRQIFRAKGEYVHISQLRWHVLSKYFLQIGILYCIVLAFYLLYYFIGKLYLRPVNDVAHDVDGLVVFTLEVLPEVALRGHWRLETNQCSFNS